MLNVRLAYDHRLEIFVHLVVAGNVFVGVFLCYPFSHEMSWVRSKTELDQLLRVCLLILGNSGK